MSWELGNINKTTGENIEEAGYVRLIALHTPIVAGKEYELETNVTGSGITIYWYNASDVYLGSTAGASGTAPANAIKARFSMLAADLPSAHKVYRLISTPAQFLEMSGAPAQNWRLKNDLDMTGQIGAIHAYSGKLDGSGYTVSNYNTNHWYCFDILNGAGLKNIKLVITTAYSHLFYSASNRENISIENVHLVYDSTGANNRVIQTVPQTSWVIDGFTIEGGLQNFINGNAYCAIKNVRIFINKPVTTFKFCVDYYGPLVQNIQIHAAEITSTSTKEVLLFDTLRTSGAVVENLFFNIIVKAKWFTLIDKAYPNTTIRNGYIIGDIHLTEGTLNDYNVSLFIREFSGTTSPRYLQNCYVNISNFRSEMFNQIVGNFDHLGFNDWYIPSKDELSLIFQIKSNNLFDPVIRSTWYSFGGASYSRFMPMSSSQVGTNTYNVIQNSSTAWTSLDKRSGYASLILCRDVSGVTGNSIGDEVQGAVLIHKNGDIGIVASKTPVASGFQIFNYGARGTTLATGTAVGTGKANTALMLAAGVDNASGANWPTHEFSNTLVAPSLAVFIKSNQIVQTGVHIHISNFSLPGIIWNDVNGVEDYHSLVEMHDPDTYVGWDFSNVWEAPTESILPLLKQNLVYPFDTYAIFIKEFSRINSTHFLLSLLAFGIPQDIEYGVDIFEGETLLQNITGSGVHIVTLEERDHYLSVVPYVIIDQVKEYQSASNWYHYGIDQLTPQILDVLNADYISTLEDENRASRNIHGSILYNGYVYGCPRNPYDGTGVHEGLPSIARINVNDYSDWELLEINCGPDYPDTILYNFEQIVEIGGFLFTIGVRQGFVVPDPVAPVGVYLVVIDPQSFSYKLFRIPEPNFHSEPLATDGTYLYIITPQYIYKVNPSDYTNPPNQFYIEDVDLITPQNWGQPGWIYDSYIQGGYLVNPVSGYAGWDKGFCHAAVADGMHLFAAYTSGAASGYQPLKGQNGIHEIHVIRTSDMSAVSWRYIPKCTDDMCQTTDFLFFGIEVQAGANPATYGYGWGTYALKKSELISQGYNCPIYGLPKLHKDDNPPAIQSYASLIFGNYLLDFKTDMRCYILDITDVESWSLTEDVGKRTLDVVRFKVAGSFNLRGVPNEAVLDENNVFHSFLWASPSGAIRYQIPGYSFFTPPTTQTIGANIVGFDVTLAGYVLNDNGASVIAVGFEIGDNDDPSTWTESIPATGYPSFTADLLNMLPGAYYYHAFAENAEGVGYGEVFVFEIEEPPPHTPTPTPTPTPPEPTPTPPEPTPTPTPTPPAPTPTPPEPTPTPTPPAPTPTPPAPTPTPPAPTPTPPEPTPSATPTPTPPAPTPTPPEPTPSATPTPTPPASTPTPPEPTPSATPTPTPPAPTPTPPEPTPSATPTPTPPQPGNWVYMPTIYLGSIPIAGKFIKLD
jgi:hypothetical protein